MKELKFRVWHEKNKEMYYKTRIGAWGHEKNDSHAENFVYSESEDEWIYLNPEEEIKIMQYIGKKDINGKDIYEGDILRGFKRTIQEEESIDKVTFLNGCYMIGSWTAQEYFSRFIGVRVIGNQFQGNCINKIKITEDLRKAFCKNYAIPLKIYKKDVFEDRLELLDELYDTKKKWAEFVESLTYYESEQEYFKRRDALIEQIITSIKGKEGYAQFNSEDSTFFQTKLKIENRDLNKLDPEKSYYFLDMKKANFQALKAYDKTIFSGCDTWEKYLGQYTYDKSLINSKYFRQVVLGNLNPKRIQSYQKLILDKYIDIILSHSPKANCYTCGSDGILIERESCEISFKQIEDLIKDCPIDFTLSEIKVKKINKEIYKIITIQGESPKNPYKGVSHIALPILIKKIKDLPVKDFDFYFISDSGFLSKFLEDPLPTVERGKE